MKEVPTEVLAGWFVTFAQLANHSLGPVQRELATQRAGEVLHAIGISEFKVGHTVFNAVRPVRETIEIIQSAPRTKAHPKT